MTNQLNGQATQIKFYPGLGFAPVINQPKEAVAAKLTAQIIVTSAKS